MDLSVRIHYLLVDHPEGMTVKEICNALDKTEAPVRKAIDRGRHFLYIIGYEPSQYHISPAIWATTVPPDDMPRPERKRQLSETVREKQREYGRNYYREVTKPSESKKHEDRLAKLVIPPSPYKTEIRGPWPKQH